MDNKDVQTVSVLNKLENIERLTMLGVKSVLDIDEAVMLTGYSRAHLYRLTSEQRIPHFKKDRKLFFRKSELEDWMTETRIPTVKEVEMDASKYDLLRR